MTGTSIPAAISALRAGEVVVVPTDTVYGLAALPHLPPAVDRIFELKGRRGGKALPVLGHSLEALATVASFDSRARALAARSWPGPLTLVLRRTQGFTHDLGGSDDETVAVRVPDHEVILTLLVATGPLAVTSANRSGASPARDAREAARLFPEVPVLDGGPSGDRPSTVVSLLGAPEILREGTLTARDLEL